MKYRVVTEQGAEEEIRDACQWIARHSPRNAALWAVGLRDLIATLGQFPRRGPVAPENGYFEEEIRQVLYGNYRVLYTIRKKSVHVLHVRHGARRYLGEDF